MIVECPKCKKKYRVKDGDVPVGGAPVQCPSCGNIFTIYREPLKIHLEPLEGVAPSPPPTYEKPAPSFEASTSTPSSQPAQAAERLKAALGLGGMDDFPADWPEEKKQKHRHAKRLARSLAKDLLLYHGDKIEQGLREGNLKQLLGEEIKKSWDFYKKNVDPEVLQTTNYFKDALNDIIGKGRKIFI